MPRRARLRTSRVVMAIATVIAAIAVRTTVAAARQRIRTTVAVARQRDARLVCFASCARSITHPTRSSTAFQTQTVRGLQLLLQLRNSRCILRKLYSQATRLQQSWVNLPVHFHQCHPFQYLHVQIASIFHVPCAVRSNGLCGNLCRQPGRCC